MGCGTVAQRHARGGIDVIAHRGASAYAPENTLAAFHSASALRAQWFELDCTLSKDGEVVVIHDDSVDRTTNGRGNVGEMTWAELRVLDAGSWGPWKGDDFAGEGLPLLSEALSLAKKDKIGVYIEIKPRGDDSALLKDIAKRVGAGGDASVVRGDLLKLIEQHGSGNIELVDRVIEQLRQRTSTKHVVVQSFSPVACLLMQSRMPKVRVEWLVAQNDTFPELMNELTHWTAWIQPDGVNVCADDLPEARVRQIHDAGMTVAVWTVDKEEDMRRFAQYGVDSIITNKPDVCADVLSAMGKGRSK